MATPNTVSWHKKDRGVKCHAKRCESLQVSNRLCEKHNAIWLSDRFQPPMPDYENPERGVKQQVQETAKFATQLKNEISSAPMLTVHDAHQMHVRMLELDKTIKGLERTTAEITQPHRDQIEMLEAQMQKSIDNYKHLHGCAVERLREFEVREGIAILAKHEVPSLSGVVAKKGASVRPIASSKKAPGGRR